MLGLTKPTCSPALHERFLSRSVIFRVYSAGDSSLLFGEISGSALAGIEAALSRFLKPLLSESDGWGKADAEQKVNTGLQRVSITWYVVVLSISCY